MALVLFLMVKGMNRLRDLTHKKEAEKPAEPAKPTQEELLTQILAELQKKDAK